MSSSIAMSIARDSASAVQSASMHPFDMDFVVRYLPDFRREDIISRPKFVAFPSAESIELLSRSEFHRRSEVTFGLYFNALHDDGSTNDAMIDKVMVFFDRLVEFFSSNGFASVGKVYRATSIERDPVLGLESLDEAGIGYTGMMVTFS